MKKERSELYRNISRIPASLLLTVTLGMSQDVAAYEPFCAPDDICVKVNGRVTGYTPNSPNAIETGQCEEPCHITASNNPVIFGITAACPAGIPFGSRVLVSNTENKSKAEGNIYTCHDVGDLGRVGDPETTVDIAVNYKNDDPNLYTSEVATLIFKLPEEKAEEPVENLEVFSREYMPQPKNFPVQIPTLSR
jgi:hypothetical protein